LKAAWRTTLPGEDQRLSTPAIAPGMAVATGPTTVVRFDPASGAVLWNIGRAQGAPVPPAIDPAAGQNGVIVFTEGNDHGQSGVVGLDASDGSQLWRLPFTKASRSAPTIDGGTVFVGGRDRFVYAVDVATGRLAWKVAVAGEVDSSPAVAAGLVYVVGEDRSRGVARLYALDRATGKTAWSYSPAHFSQNVSSPAVAGRTVYVGFGDSLVRAFDAASGAILWTAQVRLDFSPLTSPAVADGGVFVADRQGGLYRLDARTGKREWDFQFDATDILGSPLVAGATVYLGLNDGSIIAVDLGTGRLRWRTRLRAGPVGALAPAGDLLLVPLLGSHGGVVAFAHTSGPLLDVASPTTLNLPVGLLNFAGAAAIMLALLLGVFGTLLRRVAVESDAPELPGESESDLAGEDAP
jgi:outer membrane protein assembly factor BamB